MTRKDYVAIAEAFRSSRPNISAIADADVAYGAETAWRNSRNAVANVLAADNPRFDRTRFNKATEV